ncbi:YtxH domain-containing protein [Sphingomonas donggukensis]|uniref:YtxH domain-containing protein n=1 Tax=Sphingomonas donggukensis TaxID=2949093 RepID=A0ABY4TSX5_9SPHN|nr:YtxH domain-containing protein [Sphingomonas donggukensis]URW75512.1 YtxH domain-containing protein [Sphingomonas donggukensis]
MTIPDTRPPAPNRNPKGAGAPIVLSLVVGAAIGFVVHQPTVGFLVGAAVGGGIALLLWMRDRRG